MRTFFLLVLVSAYASTQGVAQEAHSPAVRDAGAHASAPGLAAARATGSIRVDGRLDEETWAAATPATEFTQLDPAEGKPATEPTEIRVLYDDEALYVGARLRDSAPPTTRLGRRDMSMEASDWLTVILDSYHDHRTAYSFEINPSGVRRDQTRSENREDSSWDPVWEVETSIDSTGWTAELRIPFSQLRFNPAREQTWGIQVERQIARKGELAVFSFTPRSQPGGIPRFGHLTGLASLRTGKRLEVLPYSVMKAEHVDRGGNPFRSDREYTPAAGVDLKYRVTSDLTLDATVNPDFGQVEVDPAEVNLSAIETRFQEKRPFFVEGSEIFNFGATTTLGPPGNALLYSRRIGSAPRLSPPTTLADQPSAASILGAVKLSGRTAGRWSVGVLDAVTRQEVALYRDVAGVDRQMVVEPLTNYFVGRLRRDFRAGRSIVGGMITSVHRDLETAELQNALRSNAYTGGVDFRHDWAGRTWSVRGFASGSYIGGNPWALVTAQRAPWRYFQRPDATHLEVDTAASSMQGYSAQVQLARQVGRHWSGSVTGGAVSPGFEVNDLGFQSRGDRLDGVLVVGYVENRPGRFLRSWNVTSRAAGEVNYAGQQVGNSLFLGSNWRTLNYWTTLLNVGAGVRSLDDRLTRGGPLALRPANGRIAVALYSDDRKPFVGGWDVYYQVSEDGSTVLRTSPAFQIKPFASWSLNLAPGLSRVHSEAQFWTSVAAPGERATFGRRYIFSELDQTTFSLDTRLNVTFSPKLSLQMYAQPFISSADFGDPAQLRAARTFDFQVFGKDLGETEPTARGVRIYPEGKGSSSSSFELRERDFNLRSLRGNAVLRWEYRPGSTLYLAWQQDRRDLDSVGDFDFARDQTALFSAQPDNIFVLKVSYWLNP